jgi:hypothetical protein
MTYIQSFKLPSYVNRAVKRLFERNNVDKVLSDDCWVAGGFPRFIFRAMLKIEKDFASRSSLDKMEKMFMFIKTYFNEGGDIDIFTNNNNNAKGICSTLASGSCHRWKYSSMYSENVCNTFSSVDVKIQIVNKFFYESVKECFGEFDISNCKMALVKSGEDYEMLYTQDAYESNKSNLIDIVKYDNPFLSSRLYKYINKYKYAFDKNDKNTVKIIDSYLFKLLENNWTNLPKQNGYQIDMSDLRATAVKGLHSCIGLSLNQLVIFLGLFEETKTEFNGYGHYIHHVYDWAAEEIARSAN